METTLDEARRCPKCQMPGEFAGSQDAPRMPRGTKLHRYVCKNERCRWNGTVCRIVQINPDGTIPAAVTNRPKSFPAIPDRTEQVRAQIDQQLGLETTGGGEVRR